MRQSRFSSTALQLIVLLAAVLSWGGAVAFAQNSDFNLALHANSHASAKDAGLPEYPGATLYKTTDDNSTADLGLTLGDTHFRLVVVKYTTADSPDQVIGFFRKPLSRYGEVLECNQGKPVGAPAASHSGLTCDEQKEGHLTIADHKALSNGHDLRAGSPHQFRIVSIEDARPGSTRFALVYVDFPKDSDQAEKQK